MSPSPRKIILGRGREVTYHMYGCLLIFLQHPLQGRKEGRKQG